MIIELPEPCLVVLIGAAGSGKSTLAARLFAPDEVLSSDANRALLTGDAADQGVTIPMEGHIESFNVATAAAVLCYEVRRQQGK